MSRMKIAVFPGSFDPPTLGHYDVLERGSRLFDRIVVGVLVNPEKKGLLDPALRVELIEKHVKTCDLSERVTVERFSGLAIDFATEHDADWILRGIRSPADADPELAMALTNRDASPGGVETVLLPTIPSLVHVRGTLVRQIALGGGDFGAFVAPEVERALKAAVKS